MDNLINDNQLVDNGNLETPNGAGQEPSNQGAPQGSPEVELKTYDFAGVKVNGADPNLATAHKSYKDAVSHIQTLTAKVKELESSKASTNSKEPQKNEQQGQEVNKIDFVYNEVLESKFEKHKAQVYSKLEQNLGEEFNAIRPMMEQALQNLSPIEKSRINIEGLSKVALGELAYSRMVKTPEQQMQNPQYQQAAINNPNVRENVIANELNKYQNQETLPPNMPNNVGNTPIANEGDKPAKTFKGAADRAKKARIAKQQGGYRGVQGIR